MKWKLGKIVLALLMVAAIALPGCRRDTDIQSLSHISGPLDITGAGTYAAPALYLAGDSNTGIYQSAADNIDIAVAGANILNVSAAGPDWGGSAFTVDTTGGILMDADAASHINTAGAGIDLTLEAEAGEIHIKGDEAAATGITLDADDAAGTGVTINVGATGGLNVSGGLTDIGGGTCGVAAGDNDLCVAADVEVDGELEVDGSTDLDGTGVDADVSGAISLDADTASNFNVSGAGLDLTLESETGSVIIKGDEAVATAITLDADEAAGTGVTINVGATNGLIVSGGVTNIGGGTPAVATGDNDLYVNDALEVDGEAEFDGVIDADSTSDFADTATFSKGSGDALSVSSGGALNNEGTLDQNGTSDFGAAITCSFAGNCLTSGTTADIEWLGFASFGDGAPDGVTDGTAEDVYVEGGLEVDGAIYADGAIDADSTLDVAGATALGTTLSVAGTTALAADVTLATDPTGGNALAKTEYIGLPRITLAPLGTMVNGTTNTVIVDIGDSETPATDWTAIDADVVVSNDGTYYRQGTASLKVAVATTADDGDGITNALATGDQNWTDDEAFGFWVYATKAITTAGDWTLQIHDATAGGGFTDVNLPAITADSWQWVELDVTLGNNNLKDVITDLSITLSAAGAAQAANSAYDIYFDFICKWDVADEDALPQDIPYDGVLGLMTIDVTSGGAAAVTPVLYTDYFVHYQSGADAIVAITDQSNTDLLGIALIAY